MPGGRPSDVRYLLRLGLYLFPLCFSLQYLDIKLSSKVDVTVE
jgi:hypothetical protein